MHGSIGRSRTNGWADTQDKTMADVMKPTTPDASNGGVADNAAAGDPSRFAPRIESAAEISTLIEQAAHDLRSSLNAIQSWSYVLDRSVETLPPPAQRALEGMRSGMQQQLALIEEMEEAVRLLFNEGQPAWETTDLLVAAEQAIADKRVAAEARGVQLMPLSSELAGGDDFVVQGDALRLAPLLRHLLIHCVWRAPAGGTVTVYLTAEANYVKFRISESQPVDRSRGASRLATLTDFFGRRAPADGTPTPRQSTALLLTRRIVEMQGAELTAENINCDADNVTVCIAVRFPRAHA